MQHTTVTDTVQHEQTQQITVQPEQHFGEILPSAHPKRDNIRERLQQKIEQSIWDEDCLSKIGKSTMCKHQQKDTFCNDLLEYLIHDKMPPTLRRQRKFIVREQDYIVMNSLLYQVFHPSDKSRVRLRLCVPITLQKAVISAAHCTVACHLGVTKTHEILASNFTWPGMRADVEKYINSCDICLKAKSTHKLEQVPRTLYEYTCAPFIRLHVDLIGPLNKSSKGFISIFTIVDSFSGWLIAIPCKNTRTETLVREFHDKVICMFGSPVILHADNGPQYISALWQKFCKIMKIKLTHSAVYHPQSNGLVEVRNRDVVQQLRCLAHDNVNSWSDHLPAVTAALNATIHTAHGASPYNILFGRDPINEFNREYVENEAQPLYSVLEEILCA